MHPFMPLTRYLQFVGRCMKYDVKKQPNLQKALLIHLDGCQYDDQFRFLLWSSFKGVSAMSLDKHSRADRDVMKPVDAGGEGASQDKKDVVNFDL